MHIKTILRMNHTLFLNRTFQMKTSRSSVYKHEPHTSQETQPEETDPIGTANRIMMK